MCFIFNPFRNYFDIERFADCDERDRNRFRGTAAAQP
jgi:hypothetical protein